MPSNIAEIVVKAHALSTSEPQTKKCYNVYHFLRTVTIGNASKTQVKNAFVTAIQTPVEAALSVAYVGDYIDVRFLDDALDPYQTFTYSGVGAITGDNLPSLNAVCIQLKTGIRGRSYRGSKHYGPVAESDTTLDHLGSGAQTRYNAVGAAILAGFTDAGGFIWQPIVVSTLLSQTAVNPTTVNGAPVTSTLLDIYIGTMRRRKQRSA